MVNKRFLDLAERMRNPKLPEPRENHQKIIPASDPNSVVLEGLGVDYGCIFKSGSGKNKTFTTDGQKVTKILEDVRSLFYDSQTQELYFIKRTELYKWPDELVKDFGGEELWGIGKFKGDILVSLIDAGEIADTNGNVRYNGLVRPHKLREFNEELYHTESRGGRGLVKTSTGKRIAGTGKWSNGLGILSDRLYFGGSDNVIYSYDGAKVEKICDVDFAIWSIHGVKEKEKNVIYCSGGNKIGIEVITLDDSGKVENKNTIFKDSVNEAGSIASAPLEFIKKLNKEAKV